MTSRQYHAIDERVVEEIKRLHKKHPKLGHHGLLEALHDEKIHVDPQRLEAFMTEHEIRAERPWLPWRSAWPTALVGRCRLVARRRRPTR